MSMIDRQQENPYENLIGKQVRINKITIDSMDPEDYYYVKQYEDKVGTIIDCTVGQSGVPTFHVKFDEEVYGYFYDNDFSFLQEKDLPETIPQ